MKLSTRLVFAIVAIASLAAYSNSLRVPFILDDYRAIVHNYGLRDLGNLWYAMTSDSPGRPFLFLTLALNYAFGGLNVFGYHIVNLLLHIGTAWMVFLVTADIFRRGGITERAYPAFVSIIFAVHPMNVEAVTYIISRSSVIMTFFYLLAFRLLTLSRLEFNARYFAGFLFFVLAVFTKETSITLPALMTIFVYQFEGIERLKNSKAALALLWLMLPAYFFYRFLVLGHPLEPVDTERVATNLSYFQTQLAVVGLEYIPRIIVPINQMFDGYHFLEKSLFDIKVISGGAILFAMVLYSLKNFHKNKIPSFAIIWFLTGLSITSSFIPILDTYVERRLYIALPPFLLAIAYAIHSLRASLSISGKPIIVVATAVAITFGILTFQRNSLHTEPIKLMEDTIKKSPRRSRNYAVLSHQYILLKDFAKAEKIKRFAAKLFPEDVRIQLGFSWILGLRGKFGEMEKVLKSINPVRESDKAEYLNYMAVIAGQKGFFDRAKTFLAKSLELMPGYTEATSNMAILHKMFGQKEEALRLMREAVKKHPNVGDYHFQLGSLLEEENRAEAIREYRKALTLAPGHTGAEAALKKLGLL